MGGRPQGRSLSTASSAGLAGDPASAGGLRHATAIRPIDPPCTAALRRDPARADRAARRAGRGGARPTTDADRAGRRGPGVRPGARRTVPLAGRRAASSGTPIRPAAPAVAARSPGRRPRRGGRSGDPQRRSGHRALRRSGCRATGDHSGPRRRAADHPRAGPTRRTSWPAGHRRHAVGRAAARSPGLPGRGVPALGPAPGHGLSGPTGTARPRPGATAADRWGRPPAAGAWGWPPAAGPWGWPPHGQRWASSAGSRTASRSYSSAVL